MKRRKCEDCNELADVILYRVDMEDVCGSWFCERCAEPLFESGLYTDEHQTNRTTRWDEEEVNY